MNIVKKLLIILILLSSFGCFGKKIQDNIKSPELNVGHTISVEKNISAIEISIKGKVDKKNLNINNKAIDMIIDKGDSTLICLAVPQATINSGETLVSTKDGSDLNYQIVNIIEKSLTSKNIVRNITESESINFYSLVGDFNENGEVDLTDFQNFSSNYGRLKTDYGYIEKYETYPSTKGNGLGWSEIFVTKSSDGAINLYDFLVFATNYGKKLPINLKTNSDGLKASITLSVTSIDTNNINEVFIEWGDGNSNSINSGFDNISLSHTYGTYGIYDITITNKSSSGINSQGKYSLKIASGKIITFEDKRIEKFIRDATGNDIYPIYDTEVVEIRDFNISSSNITSLKGLENLKNLSELYIENNNIVDLSPLKNLNLTKLYLKGNKDLNLQLGYGNREILNSLVAKGCIVRFDEVPSTALSFEDKNLEKLIRNQLNYPYGYLDQDLLSKITSLYFDVNSYIKSLKGIENLTNLNGLYINGFAGAIDINQLKDLKNLQSLYVWDLGVKNIESISLLPKLNNLGLGYPLLTNENTLQNMNFENIGTLYICGKQVKSNGVVNQVEFDKANALSKKLLGVYNNINGKSSSDFERIKNTYDHIVSNTHYDTEFFDNGSFNWYRDYSAYYVLAEGKGVCGEYARAFKVLLSYFNIESLIVSSTPMNHDWNMISLNGKYYHCDITWDSGNYYFFLLSDTDMASRGQGDGLPRPGHYEWDSTLPKCLETYNMTRSTNININRSMQNRIMYCP